MDLISNVLYHEDVLASVPSAHIAAWDLIRLLFGD
jgi:hypothetical protein